MAGACGAALALAVWFGAGCATPVDISYVAPEPDGYYTGRVPNFGARSNPDPQKRKFRVAYLQVDFSRWDTGAGARECMEPTFFEILYLPLREQAAKSPRGVRIRGTDMGASTKELFNNLYGLSTEQLEKMASSGSTHESDKQFLHSYWRNAKALNAELERRYPKLFSSSPSAFPLDVLLGYLADTTPGQRRNSLYEAWLFGLPEHANPPEEDDDGETPDCLVRKEAFRDPFDAIAAALFKLSKEEFEKLEPANPKDHRWLASPW